MVLLIWELEKSNQEQEREEEKLELIERRRRKLQLLLRIIPQLRILPTLRAQTHSIQIVVVQFLPYLHHFLPPNIVLISFLTTLTNTRCTLE
jgi:hypothetical protein